MRTMRDSMASGNPALGTNNMLLAARRVVATRATHALPPDFMMPPEWPPNAEAIANQLGFAKPDANSIEEQFRIVLERITRAGSALSEIRSSLERPATLAYRRVQTVHKPRVLLAIAEIWIFSRRPARVRRNRSHYA